MTDLQSTSRVVMIRPVRFAGNVETAASNRFQQLDTLHADAQQRASAEFDGLVSALRQAGVQVDVFDDTPEPHTPDAVFPNNWVSFHADGTVVLYPMLAANRRLERRDDILEALHARGFRMQCRIDLSPHEAQQKFLEGTGSLVLDRVQRLAYACVSPRTDLDVLGDFAQQLDYELVVFAARDAAGVPIYHTNVLLCVGTRFAVICAAAIDPPQRDAVLERLRGSGHALIDISPAQMAAFAGNLLELRTAQGDLCVAMSASAYEALTPEQRSVLSSLAGPLITAPIPTIERLGGGSVRCMLAENFLPHA